VSTLEKRNPALWKRYCGIIAAMDVIATKTYWHDEGWSTAPQSVIDDARQKTSSGLEKLNRELQRISPEEISSWKEYGYLVDWGLAGRDKMPEGKLAYLRDLLGEYLPDYLSDG
jgi:hypothetical protein